MWILVNVDDDWTHRVDRVLKVLSSDSNWGVRLGSFDPMLKNRCRQVFKFFFNDTVSWEEHKTN